MAPYMSNSENNKILIIAENHRDHGSGHLIRSLVLAEDLLSHGASVDWLIPVPAESGGLDEAEIASFASSGILPMKPVTVPRDKYDLILIDRPFVEEEDVRTLMNRGLVVGIDTGGPGRKVMPYLIDTLPRLPGDTKPNVFDSGFLPLPTKTRREWPDSPHRVLVVMGGRTKHALLEKSVDTLSEIGFPGEVRIATVDDVAVPENVQRIVVPGSLREELYAYDLVISYFGLTVFEALWARVPVVLVHPTAYHRKLTEALQLPSGGKRNIDRRAFQRLLDDWPETVERCRTIRPDEKRSLGDFLRTLVPSVQHIDPLGKFREDPVVARSSQRTYFHSGSTALYYLLPVSEKSIKYTHDYFFNEYEQQYGRTYIADFDYIEKLGKGRIEFFSPYLKSRKNRLIDIGCAYGPFMTAAREAGFDVSGIDISCEAVDYVRDLGFKTVVCGDVRTMNPDDVGGAGSFDIATMWYVIEHFPDLTKVMAALRILLKPGGLFVFSTPNAGGISGERDLTRFLLSGPADHYTIWNARSCRKTLEAFGFRLRRVRITGHHPERFFPQVKLPGIILKALGIFSRLFRLGDTFEVVAEKI